MAAPIAVNGIFTQDHINRWPRDLCPTAAATATTASGFTVQDEASGTPTAAQTFTITVHDQGIVTLLANTGLTVNENATATVTSSELAYSDDGGAFNGPAAGNHLHRNHAASAGGSLDLSGTPLPSTGLSPRPTSTPAS